MQPKDAKVAKGGGYHLGAGEWHAATCVGAATTPSEMDRRVLAVLEAQRAKAAERVLRQRVVYSTPEVDEWATAEEQSKRYLAQVRTRQEASLAEREQLIAQVNTCAWG